MSCTNTADTRTNEQIAMHAVEDMWGRDREELSDAILAALADAGRLVRPGETLASKLAPTSDGYESAARVTAVAKSLSPNPVHWRDFISTARGVIAAADEVDTLRHPAAAPVADESAAPQAASEIHYCPVHGDLLAARRSNVCLTAEPGHELARVHPLSAKDESKIANVIREAGLRWHFTGEPEKQSYACGAPDLKSLYIARALVETVGGEGRG